MGTHLLVHGLVLCGEHAPGNTTKHEHLTTCRTCLHIIAEAQWKAAEHTIDYGEFTRGN